MVRMLTAFTYEMDDPLQAVRDIQDQLDISSNLLKNSAALLFCHSKCIESGVMEIVCNSLPCDIIGCTSMYGSMPGVCGEFILTVTILTSDDVEFAAGISGPLTDKNAVDSIRTMYQETASRLSGPPDMIFAIPPTMFDVTVDVISAALDSAGSGTPVFGTVALDLNVYIAHPQTIYSTSGDTSGGTGGEAAAFNDRIPLLLIKGPVKPRFFSIRFPDKPILAQEAVVTKAEGARVISINNEPATSFLKDVGIILQDNKGFTQAMPLIVECIGSEPDVVVIQSINEKGELLCGKNISVGAVLNIGAITRDYILDTASALMENIKREGNGLFIISCFLRSVVLGGSPAAEVELMQKELENFPAPWLYISSGGELCPRYTDDGKTLNQDLHYALVACQF